MRNAGLEETQGGIKIARTNINNLRYVDDTTLMAESNIAWNSSVQFSSVAQSYPTLRPHEPQHARPPCPSPTPGACSNSSPWSQWIPSNHLVLCHPLLFLPSIFTASESSPMSQFFSSGGQSVGASASASVVPMNIQDWFPLEMTGLISLQAKGLSRVFSNTTVQKHQFFSA